MDAENAGGARSRLLDSVRTPDGELAAEILAVCPTVALLAGEPYFRSSLPAAALLIIERGLLPAAGRARLRRIAIAASRSATYRLNRRRRSVREITGRRESCAFERSAAERGPMCHSKRRLESRRRWLGVVAGGA